jgi:hypothetical protein
MTSEQALSERRGVEAVRGLLVGELGWYPHEPVQPDFGIDMFVEGADGGEPNGHMLALQIKSGPSYFQEQNEDGFVYRGSPRHLRYWLDHSLPVVLVLHNPDEDRAYWVAVTDDAVELTEKGWKIIVPRGQVLDAAATEQLQELGDDDPYTLRLNQLRSERTWMQLLRDGGTVYIEAEEWVNKSSGRGAIRLIGTRAGDGEPVVRERTIFAGLLPYSKVLPALLPWGDLQIDEYTYDEWDEELWTEETGIWDSEGKQYIGHVEDFGEWRQSRFGDQLRPYRNSMGEVDYWRLRVRLNELGESFLVVDEYLEGTP